MPIIEVVFKSEYEDRETGKKVKVVYTLTATQFSYVMKSEFTWRQLYNYLNANAERAEVEEENV